MTDTSAPTPIPESPPDDGHLPASADWFLGFALTHVVPPTPGGVDDEQSILAVGWGLGILGASRVAVWATFRDPRLRAVFISLAKTMARVRPSDELPGWTLPINELEPRERATLIAEMAPLASESRPRVSADAGVIFDVLRRHDDTVMSLDRSYVEVSNAVFRELLEAARIVTEHDVEGLLVRARRPFAEAMPSSGAGGAISAA